MDFFPEPPDPAGSDEPADPPQPVWMRAPTDVLPGVVPVELVIARSPSTVIMLTGMRAFPTGVEMSLAVRFRGQAPRRDLLSEVFDGPYEHDMNARWQEQRLKWGFELSNGRRVTNVDPWPQQPNQDHSRPHRSDDRLWEPDHPVLMGGGGGGDGRSIDRSYWLWPLPPAGRLRVVCQWLDQDIDMQTQDMDASVIRDAASRSRPAWPSPDEH